MTGAGISTDSGIPDYRGPQGTWTKDPAAMRTATIGHYVADPEVRRRAWRGRRDHAAWTAAPNAGHLALVELERAGKLRALLTQNVDGLHQLAGSSPGIVVELHGTVWEVECLSCAARTPMADELARVDEGDPDPACRACGGILKSATISFGQPLDRQVVAAAVRAASECDLFLAIGSSLTVHPAAGLCELATGNGARLVVVNAQPTPYDGIADAVVREPIGTALPALARALTG
ncbi:MAG: SIR2 family NAD-dependent protein deacylase [Frankiaceae bacterium]